MKLKIILEFFIHGLEMYRVLKICLRYIIAGIYTAHSFIALIWKSENLFETYYCRNIQGFENLFEIYIIAEIYTAHSFIPLCSYIFVCHYKQLYVMSRTSLQ